MFGRKKPDLLVVGAGPVGLFAALSLQDKGLRVQVVDREWRTGTRSYALALHADSLRRLERYGLLGEVLERSRRIRKVGLYDNQRRRAEMRISDLAEDHSFLAVLRQRDLEELLAAALLERGVKIDWNRQVSQLTPGDESVELAIDSLDKDSTGYAVQHTEWVVTKTKNAEVPFVIGADGHNSIVRRALGIDFPQVGPTQEFAVFEFRSDAELGDEMRLAFHDGLANVCWPLPDGYCRWSFELPSAEAEDGSRNKDRDVVQIGSGLYQQFDETHLRGFLAVRAPWFEGSIDLLGWRMAVRFEKRLAASVGRGRVWLIGDATHLTGPAGIQSMNVGLREADDLAEVVATALADGGSTAALEAFGQARRAEWQQLLGDGLHAGADADPWLGELAPGLLPCIPASGEDLRRLAAQLGLEF